MAHWTKLPHIARLLHSPLFRLLLLLLFQFFQPLIRQVFPVFCPVFGGQCGGRHGSYISVYCNLSSVRVSKGQKVKARDILGVVENDGSGNCVLHFQLRKEKQKLNPEVWIGR